MLYQVLQGLPGRYVGLLLLQVDAVVRLRLLALVPAAERRRTGCLARRIQSAKCKKEINKRTERFLPEVAEDEDEAEDDAADRDGDEESHVLDAAVHIICKRKNYECHLHIHTVYFIFQPLSMNINIPREMKSL